MEGMSIAQVMAQPKGPLAPRFVSLPSPIACRDPDADYNQKPKSPIGSFYDQDNSGSLQSLMANYKPETKHENPSGYGFGPSAPMQMPYRLNSPGSAPAPLPYNLGSGYTSQSVKYST